ncbi:MAG: hypothetical protein H6712_13770 [Myxococcales bacterium]|nr:hypothetical protein [Myxococcales bacterium]
MPRLQRLFLLGALSLGLAAGACKRTTGSSDTSPGSSSGDDGGSTRGRRIRRQPGMPRPHRLPASAPIVIHLERPAKALGGLRAYAPELPDDRVLLRQAVTDAGGGPFESQLVTMIDLERPWDAAFVEGELIVQMPILAARVSAVAALLADKPPVGRFGAVDLQSTGGPTPKLAWLDAEHATLTLADTEQGLATGSTLAAAYGKQAVRVDLQGAEARKVAPQLRLESLELRGAGPHDFEATAVGVPPELLAQLSKLDAGALTGLLESPGIAAGGSSRYTDYANDVKSILADLKRQVDRQSFIVQGNLENLRQRLAAVLRSWNGRTMVGVGPAKHLRLGFGADDPSKMGGAIFYLISGINDNLGMARSIGFEVPKLRFARNVRTVGESNVAVLVLEKARKYVPAELAPLVDDRGELRITMSFPKRLGAGMFVIGPGAESTLVQWLEDTQKATSASDSAGDLIAATAAVDPTTLAPMLQPGADPLAMLGLSADREPTRVVVQRDGTTVKVRVKGPEIAVMPKRIGARRGASDAPAPTRAAPSTSPPARAKPSRVGPARAKPVD